MASKRNEAEDYLLGSRDEELARLGSQHRVWAETAFALWRRAGFRSGGRILDLGCGPGFSTVDLAHLVGSSGRVVAVDASRRFLDHLEAGARALGLANIETVECDVRDLQLEPASLDGAYARWLFCFLDDPAAAVGRVAAALKPGAAFAVNDYFNYRAFTLAPRSAALDRVVVAVERFWAAEGGDLEIQGRMPSLMRDHGLTVTDISTTSVVARPGSPHWSWPASFFQAFLPRLVQGGYVTAADSRAFWSDWERRSEDPAAFMFLPPMIDVIGVKD